MTLKNLLKIKSNYKPMVKCNRNLREIFQEGETLGKKINKSNKRVLTPSEIHEFIESEKGEIHYIDMLQFKKHQDIFDTTIYVHKDKLFDIIIPMHVLDITKRYKMIHEYAHYILHSSKGRCYACHKGNTRIEQEAHAFALGFLMPTDLVEKAEKMYKQDINWWIPFFLLPQKIIESRIEWQKNKNG
ncbi:MAG: ImmA/IrrE family metallo-endopeptidase [Planctomycetaceae bacterium]|jgi:Zn-dependent peptidase ImmA (M78 family)|nr:ImmA/IrrE family metallo-endopeptidase [Planctomycetaceae bacterium]